MGDLKVTLFSTRTTRRTPLMIHARLGHGECVGLLLAYGAEVNATDINGKTALMHAVYGRDPRCVDCMKLLLAYGADPNMIARGNCNATALHIAAGTGQTPACVTLLLACGADVDAQTQRGRTPLLVAVLHGHLRIAQVLLHHGAEDIEDDDGVSLFLIHRAAMEKSFRGASLKRV